MPAGKGCSVAGRRKRRTIAISELLIYIGLCVIVLSTSRFAQARGRSPWMWGGAALALISLQLPWALLTIGPLAILVFLGKSVQPTPDATEVTQMGEVTESTIACLRCQTHQSTGNHYCINCGWDLEKAYQQDATGSEDTSPTPAGQAGLERVATSTTVVASESPATEATAGNKPEDEAQETPPEEEPAPEEQPEAPPRIISRPPTAERMTEKGLALFSQKRFQEAIDQFTKAIALDPNYKSAWAHRAKAYTRLGRPKEAAADKRRLKAI